MKSLVNKILLVLVIFNISLSASGISLVSAATIISEDYYDKNGDPVVDINSDARDTGQGFDIETGEFYSNKKEEGILSNFKFEIGWIKDYIGDKISEGVDSILSKNPIGKAWVAIRDIVKGEDFDTSESLVHYIADSLTTDKSLLENTVEAVNHNSEVANEISWFEKTFKWGTEKTGSEKEVAWSINYFLYNIGIGRGSTHKDASNGCKPGDSPAVKKPNIYFYGFDEELTVTFESPRYLLDTIPTYTDNWTVTASPDGTLVDENGNSYRYLFYEVSTQKFYYQTECGFALPAERRVECFNELLDGYGFTSEEKEDFIEFWCEELESEVDYIMYPQYTETIDKAYPMSVSTSPDTYIRIWFVFKEDAGQGYVEEKVVPFERVGKTMFEWGGMIF